MVREEMLVIQEMLALKAILVIQDQTVLKVMVALVGREETLAIQEHQEILELLGEEVAAAVVVVAAADSHLILMYVLGV